VKCFGPDAKAARIEASKVFAKNLMKKYGIPTAAYETFDDAGKALEYVKDGPLPIVVKADGLALGKGVTICFTRDEAANAVKAAMLDGAFGASGSRVVIEEYLEGPEVSVLAFTDGHVVKPMVSSMDHKRVGDGDVGPNTGGMGTIAPNPCYTPDVAERCMREIFLPTVAAMNAEGCPFKGCLYFGLMVTKYGPKVIEYNCRFGDPETQVVLPLMKSDLLTVMLAVENETLSDTPVEFDDGAACCVMLASGGYPGKYEKGKVIDPGRAGDMAEIYHSGTGRNENGALVTAGGRVLGVCCTAEDLETAVKKAYQAADQIRWDGMICRRDIGKRALGILGEKR
jgi:phosphoribosylamine--glycine ligase